MYDNMLPCTKQRHSISADWVPALCCAGLCVRCSFLLCAVLYCAVMCSTAHHSAETDRRLPVCNLSSAFATYDYPSAIFQLLKPHVTTPSTAFHLLEPHMTNPDTQAMSRCLVKSAAVWVLNSALKFAVQPAAVQCGLQACLFLYCPPHWQPSSLPVCCQCMCNTRCQMMPGQSSFIS